MDNTKSLLDEQGYPKGIKSLLESSKTSKIAETRLWDLSLMYLNGQQNVRFDKTLRQYVTLRNQPGRNQLVVNLVLNLYRAITSRLTTNYPGIAVLPASPSNEDIAKAKSSEELIKYFYHSDKVKDKLVKAIEWLVSCGSVALQEHYDPDKGCVTMEVVSPYDVFFEPGCNHPDDSSYIALRTIVRKEDLKQAYPEKAEDIDAAPTVSMSSNEDTSLPNTQTYNGGSYFYPRVELYEIYFKNGKHAFVVGDKYLYRGENPIDKMPVQFIRYTNLPDKVWGKGMIESIIDLQNLYNKARNQVIQNVELMSNPKWLIPKTAGVNGSAIRGTPGEIVYYNAAGGVPQQVSMAPLPGYVLDNIAKLQSEMLDVAGIHSTSLGKRAVGVTSGKAIEALSQQDVSQLMMTQTNIEHAVRDMATSVLCLMKKYYTKDKYIRMFDGMGSMVFKKINATDIVETPEVFLEAGSLFRDEAQDRDAKILNLLQLGLIPKELALKELSFKTGNAYVLEETRALNHAQEILDSVKAGAQIEIFANDDIPTFLEVFSGFMKSDEYYDLAEPIRDYMRDILVALAGYRPPNPENPEEAKAMDRVFPMMPKSGEYEQAALAQQIAASGPAREQMQEAMMENALMSNAYETARGQVRQQPQGNDLAVINGRATE